VGDSAAGGATSAANAPGTAPTLNTTDTRTPHANDASRVPRTPCPPLLGDAFPRQAFLFGVQKSSLVGRSRTIPMRCCNFITPLGDPRQRRQLRHVSGIKICHSHGADSPSACSRRSSCRRRAPTSRLDSEPLADKQGPRPRGPPTVDDGVLFRSWHFRIGPYLRPPPPAKLRRDRAPKLDFLGRDA